MFFSCTSWTPRRAKSSGASSSAPRWPSSSPTASSQWWLLRAAAGHITGLAPCWRWDTRSSCYVRAFVLRDKTDALDAQAIWVAAQQPHIREVPIKSEQQEACLSLHRIRAQLMKMRIMQTNALRGLLCEFGIVLPEGHKKLLQSVQGELAKAQQDNRLYDVVVLSVQEQLKRIDALQEDIDRLDRRLAAMVRQNQHMLAVQSIPGIGPLTATALVATAADLSTFKSGRQFAAWLGLTPRQVCTGGKTQQLGISKRGDTYLRTLLVHGARTVVGRSAHNSWLERLLQRRHFNVAVAALANKMVRTAWAVRPKDKPLTRSSGIRPMWL